jgi:hypothetical protein
MPERRVENMTEAELIASMGEHHLDELDARRAHWRTHATGHEGVGRSGKPACAQYGACSSELDSYTSR